MVIFFKGSVSLGPAMECTPHCYERDLVKDFTLTRQLSDAQSSDWIILKKEVKEGTTTDDLSVNLVLKHNNFLKTVFDTDYEKVSKHTNIVLNSTPLQFPEITEDKLNDGRSVICPVYYDS